MSWSTADIPDQHGRVAVVTGSNGGLGLETARQLAASGAHVVMAVRDQAKAQSAIEDIKAGVPRATLELVTLDLASQASIHVAAEQILASHNSIDLLVNNAGVMAIPERKTADGFEMQFGVNHLGHWSLTALLMPALLHTRASRIVTVTSGVYHTARPVDPANPHLRGRYGPWRAYGQAKLANFHFALGLQQQLARVGSTTASLVAHPGVSRTGLNAASVRDSGGGSSQRFFDGLAGRLGMSAANGALPQLRAATDPAAKGGELYAPAFVSNGPPVHKPILDRFGMKKAIATLWEVSERETNLRIDLREAAI